MKPTVVKLELDVDQARLLRECLKIRYEMLKEAWCKEPEPSLISTADRCRALRTYIGFIMGEE